jgi:polyphosphate kinase
MPLPTPDRLAEAADPPAPAGPGPGVLAADVQLIDRELSLLHFNRRVLALAEQPDVPVLERLRYLAIVGGNLDEFFEIRVAGLRGALRSSEPPPGMSLHEVRLEYDRIAASAHALVEQHYRVLDASVLPALRERGIVLEAHGGRTAAARAHVAACFEREIRPLLTPIGLDPAHPFPQIASKTLNFVVELSGRDAFGRETSLAIVKVPRVLPAALRLPHDASGDHATFVLLSSVIHAHLADLFPGREIVGASQFRVTRDADLWIDEDEVKNLRQALAGELRARQFGTPLRLEVAKGCPANLAAFLRTQFGLAEVDLYHCDGPVDLTRLASLIDQVDDDEDKWPPFKPGRPGRLAGAPDILVAIRQHDILLHHPYESFDPVVDFIRQAADDPDVVAVKQTIYRAGEHSAVMEALIAAARRGKEVTVVVELLARFDEEANINWAERLEQEGAQVVYGVFGLKTHAKLALLLRRERDAAGSVRLVPYAHLGTGNYHPRTTRLYSDFGLLTADPALCADANEVFLHITSLAKPARLHRLLLAPFSMHRRILEMIRREARHAREGRPARIVAKMNALIEEQVIRALYAASEAGVAIDLVVRGACALRPGVPGLSSRIRVRSIVGRFLEHHRVWMFDNDGKRDVWLASADWMGRNLFRRIEVAFPVRDPALKARVMQEGLEVYLEDNVDAWTLGPEGEWTRVVPAHGARRNSAQARLLERLRDGAQGD